ncbi:hypothetical protein FJY71_04325 [candidate division WOR-3 bacterium]|nr:hypothetical protein [candidate division WOR-3 bacterium]
MAVIVGLTVERFVGFVVAMRVAFEFPREAGVIFASRFGMVAASAARAEMGAEVPMRVGAKVATAVSV